MDPLLKIVLCVPPLAMLLVSISNITPDMICGDHEYYQTHKLANGGVILSYDECMNLGSKTLDDTKTSFKIFGGLWLGLLFGIDYIVMKIIKKSKKPKYLNHNIMGRDALSKTSVTEGSS